MKEVLPEASYYREVVFSDSAEKPGNLVRVFEGLKDGETIGYVMELNPPGYSGRISMMVGISSVDNIITGMRVIRHTETPGLGALAVRESFYSRFDGKALSPLRVVRVLPGDNEIESITGSTITTVAITNAVNDAILWYGANR